MKALKIIRNVVVWLMVVLAAGMMIFTIVSVSTFDRTDRKLFGYKAFIVLTDSMSKTDFDAGDLVLVKEVDPSTLAEGDIIAFISQDSSIELGSVDIRTLPLAECTKRIAYVSQDNYLFDLSVMDNIRMGRKGASDAEVIDAAKKCGCHEFILGLENGYQTVCGASGGHLSGGERQRISIARAMLKDAPIVILDEATSYTDPENEAVIQSALARLVRGKTLLVIAHRLSTIADADQIIVVNQGRIEATGTQDELLKSCPLYQTMWETHISVKDDGEVA